VSGDPLVGSIRATPAPVPGINLVGFLEAESGLGEIARRLLEAIEHAGIDVAPISYRRTPSRQLHPFSRGVDDAPYDVNLLCLNADTILPFADDVGPEFFAHRYSIGVCFWETDLFRAEDRTGLRFLDEVWVASKYVRNALAPHLEIPVHIVPTPVGSPPPPSFTRADLGLPEGAFMFLFLFDFVSATRKNPGAIVDAFAAAFQEGDGAFLLLKSINGAERKPVQLAELQAATAGRTDIAVRDGYVTEAERDAIVAACDCYVSLHRSEGFGLTMAEAMVQGKPVIATGYSGNLEFMTDTNSYLVPYQLVPVPEGWWARVIGAQWAEPDVEQAANLMRHVRQHSQEARARGAHARDELLERLSVSRAARFVAERLSDVRSVALTDRSLAQDVRRPILNATLALMHGPGAALDDQRSWAPVSFVRRLVRRALWPQLKAERELNATVVDALSALEQSLRDLQERIARLERLR
jgi:glycosyltransferase involved in cell wall biosynthesis